ncbi:unnamed protein product [Alopecurus aequalis]
MEPRVDPAEEARHLEVMDGLGVYGAAWALAKRMTPADVHLNQRRLLLVRALVQGGPIPQLFPELGEVGHDGNNAEHRIPVTILNADGVEKAAHIRYLQANAAYRIIGSGWSQFVQESGISRGDRLDVYTCSRGDGERCLFFFKS